MEIQGASDALPKEVGVLLEVYDAMLVPWILNNSELLLPLMHGHTVEAEELSLLLQLGELLLRNQVNDMRPKGKILYKVRIN